MESCVDHQNEREMIVSNFLTTCFNKNAGTFMHVITDMDVLRNTLEFSRCFLSGSMACGVLRNQQSERAAMKFVDGIIKFIRCSHGRNEWVCSPCARTYLRYLQDVHDEIPAASRLGIAGAIMVQNE